MRNQALILFLLLFSVALSGCLQNAPSEELEQFSEKGVLSIEELAEIGIVVENQPMVTIEPPDIFAGEGFKGGFIVMYGDQTTLGYIVQLYEDKYGANNVYSEKRDMLVEASDGIIEERILENPFVFVRTTNEIGKENLTLFYNYKKFNILLIGSSEVKDNSPGFTYEKFLTIANKVVEKLDSN